MKRTKQIVILILLISVLFTVSGCIKPEEKKDISVAEAYIKSTYGSNYRIVGYNRKQYRASGLSPARVKVEQNGIEYYVDVSDGQVVEDNYSEFYAGNIVYNYINDCMRAKGTQQDLSGSIIKTTTRFTTISDRKSLLYVSMDCSSVQNFDELVQTVDSAGAVYSVYFTVEMLETSKADSESWLYDFYLTCQEELDSYSIIVIIKDPAGNATVEQVSFGNAPEPNGETLTKDGFIAKYY